jgi:Flp pilus assembly CpaF family ATPase
MEQYRNISAWHKIMKILSYDSVSELEVTGREGIWVVKNGKRQRVSNLSWGRGGDSETASEKAFFSDFEQVVLPSMHATGFDRPSKEHGIYEGALIYVVRNADGKRETIHARLHMMLPPSCEFPQVTIAKRSESLTTLDVMVQAGTLDNTMLNFIKKAVEHKQTIVFSAGSGGGKTTMLRACCNYLAPDERVIVCEDSPELTLPIGNVSYLQSQPWRPGIDMNDVISLEYLVAQANRMRPDRIIVGETRSKEFHGFLQAANSGYSGSFTTLHANSPKECLDRMSMLDSEAEPGRDTTTINKGIAYAIDFIIQLAKDNETGRHWIQSIEEISKTVSTSNAQIATATIFDYQNGSFIHKIGQLSDEKRSLLGI